MTIESATVMQIASFAWPTSRLTAALPSSSAFIGSANCKNHFCQSGIDSCFSNSFETPVSLRSRSTYAVLRPSSSDGTSSASSVSRTDMCMKRTEALFASARAFWPRPA